MAARPPYRANGTLQFQSRTMYYSSKYTFVRIYYIAIQLLLSLFLLPLNTSVLLTIAALSRFHLLRSEEQLNRQLLVQNPRFYPNTVLITGINTVRGLKLARQFYYGGHRVIGADVGLPPVRSGSSMSNTIFAYYALSKSQYVSSLMDIIHREKVDLWIPYSDRVTPIEEGMAKSTIESRTACRCFHLNVDFVSLFGQNDSFLQYVTERGLPTVEKQNVQTRDSIHRILNRSPNKAYIIYDPSKGTVRDAVHLPKNTPSQTYSELSVLAITKDRPWVLKQHARLGKYWVDVVLVRGHLRAMKVRPLRSKPFETGNSRMDSGLYETMRRMMISFAEKAGHRISGHLSIKLMVDEEVSINSICHTIYICGCRQGSSAVSELLDDPPSDLYSFYLEMLSPELNGISSTTKLQSLGESRHSHTTFVSSAVPQQTPMPSPWLLQSAAKLREQIQQLHYSVTSMFHLDQEVISFAPFDWTRFSAHDPLPWWWHYHVSQPLNGLSSVFDGEIEISVKKFS